MNYRGWTRIERIAAPIALLLLVVAPVVAWFGLRTLGWI